MQSKYFVSAIPNSKNDSVEIIGPNILRVKINAKPVDGEANKRLVLILADHFDVPKSNINIQTGATFRQKIVIVETDRYYYNADQNKNF